MTLEDWVLGFLNPSKAVSTSIKLFANNVLCTMIADMESSSPPPYILGRKIIVVNSLDACKFVLSTGHTSFTTNYQNHVSRLLSNRKIVRPGHPHFREIVYSAMTGEALQNRLLFIGAAYMSNHQVLRLAKAMNLIKLLLERVAKWIVRPSPEATGSLPSAE